MALPRIRILALALAAALLQGGSATAAPEGGGAPAAGDRPALLKRLYRALGLEERVRSLARDVVQEVAPGDAAGTEAILKKVDWSPVDAVLLAELDRKVDAAALAECLPLLEGPEGGKVRRLLLLDRSLASVREALGEEARGSGEDGDLESRLKSVLVEAIVKSSPGLAVAANEKEAHRRLRNIVSCQAQMQVSARIDGDEDGLGEYATLMELTGAVGLRAGFTAGTPSTTDFSSKAAPLSVPMLTPALGKVDAAGIATMGGYCFRVFLPGPGGEGKAGFVHETGPPTDPGLDGDSLLIDVDLSEEIWCAYAWPEKRGVTGRRAFFVTAEGDVYSSPNEVAQWDGARKAPPGDSALTGPGFKAKPAAGKRGRDGDVWKAEE